MMRKLLTGLFVLFFAAIVPLALAHVEETSQSEHEDSGIGHQFEEILPFHHFSEGHVFAGVMLIVLWVSLFYTLYSAFRLLRKKKKR